MTEVIITALFVGIFLAIVILPAGLAIILLARIVDWMDKK